MALTITALPNDAAVSKTFTEVGRDRTSSEFLNTSDSSSALDSRMTVKQSIIGKTSTGVPIRRSLVQMKYSAPTTQVVNGNTRVTSEELTVNVTITGPTALATLTPTHRKDAVAFLKALLSGSVVDALARGEV